MVRSTKIFHEKPTCGSILRRVNAFVTEGVRSGLYKHGYIVGHYPWLFLTVPLLVTCLFTLGVLKFRADQEIRHLFTPVNAKSHGEFDIVKSYFDDEGGLFDLMLYFEAKDGGSLLRPGYPDHLKRLIEYLYYNYTIPDPLNASRALSFGRDLRINHAEEWTFVLDVLKLLKVAGTNSTLIRRAIKLTYPVATTFKGPIYLGNTLSTITTHPISHVMTGVQTMRINLRSACGPPEHLELLKQWTYNFLNPDSIHVDPYLRFTPWNDYLMTKELLRVSWILIPYVSFSFVALMAFAVCASLTDSVITSKPWEALAGVSSVGLAVGSSFGVLFLLDYSFVGTLAVMPVLVLAMGLDVTFIVLRNWQSTNPELDVPSRLAETWGESGTSVIITSLTNVMSTSIGMITDTPAIHTFCLSTTIAVLFLFFYQITFFAAAITLGGRRESKNRNSFFWCLKSKPNVNSSTSKKQPLEPRRSLEYPPPTPRCPSHDAATSAAQLANGIANGVFSIIGSNSPDATAAAAAAQNSSHVISRGQIVAVRILNDDWWYKISKKMAAVLCNTYSRLVVVIALALYWITSVWGCLHLELGLSPEKMFLPDSVILSSVKADRANVLLNVFVHKPPNFTLDSDTEAFYSMVKELEALPECLGPDSTYLWLRDYEKCLEYLGDERNHNFYTYLKTFRDLADYARWRPYFALRQVNNGSSNEVELVKFFFSIAYKRHRNWNERLQYTQTFRKITEKYADKFNVSIYCDDNNNFIVDQLEAIPGNTLQDVLITGLCMAVICLLFIPNFFNTICAMATIFSINVGVFGYLVHWDVALDPVSMTSLLMSIGYSVDFTSHISFHFYVSSGASQREKLVAALSSIGLPMIETGFSTILSVGCLCLVKSYLVWVYFKTTFLVVVLGLFHGLIVLPTFLAWLPMDVWEWIYRADRVDNNKVHVDRGQANSEFVTSANEHCSPTCQASSAKPDIVQIALGQRD